jgi:predicted histidine transporter YuiF (NhaC family)
VDVSNLPKIVMWFCLIMGTAILIVGLVIAIIETYRYKAVADSAKKVVDKAVTAAEKDEKTDADFTEQGAVSDTLESVAKLATSLKDLDVGTRLLVLGVALFAIAGIAAGLDSIASAIA